MAPRLARGSLEGMPLPRAKTRGLAILGARLISRGPGSDDRDDGRLVLGGGRLGDRFTIRAEYAFGDGRA